MKVYAIYDVKADACQPQLYVMQNNGVAIRAFAAALENPNGDLRLISQYPDDFFLVCLGDFDQHSTGAIIVDAEEPRVACFGDLVNKG